MGKAARSACSSPNRPTFARRLSDRISSVSRRRQPKAPEECSRRSSCHHAQCSQTQNPPRIALQNIDFAEDAVVITALDTVPFCCHEDLLSMSRSQMVSAAQSLNQKLPFVLHIDTSDARSDSFIRNSIELIVGIRPQSQPSAQTSPPSITPRAVSSPLTPSRTVNSSPRAVTSPCISPRSIMSSPPSKRSRYPSISMTMSPPLTVLDEEEEAESSFLDDRPPRRRRTTADRLKLLSTAPSTPTRPRTRHSASPYAPARRTRLAFEADLPSLSTQSLLAFSSLESRQQLANDSDLSLDIQSDMDTTF